MKVLVLPDVREYLNDLSYILYERDYFSYLESSEKYVEELLKEIEISLPIRQKRFAPTYFSKYGKNLLYTSFRKNKTTQWYVFFTIHHRKEETIYLIRYISNNHVIAQHL